MRVHMQILKHLDHPWGNMKLLNPNLTMKLQKNQRQWLQLPRFWGKSKSWGGTTAEMYKNSCEKIWIQRVIPGCSSKI